MKYIYIILIAFVSVLTVSCDGDAVDNRPVLEAVTAPEITAPQSGKQYVLKEDNASSVAETFKWSAGVYSTDVVVKYTVLMDKKGGDFTKATSIAVTSNVTEVGVLVKDMNQAAIDLGAPVDVVTLFDVKVTSSVSGGVSMISKTPITISVTPYSGKIPYNFTDWYLVGDATVSGWDNNKGNQILFRNPTNSNEYTFTGFFKKGYFKTISHLGSWAPMYGGSNGSLVYRATEADPDPASIEITADGYYTFKMDVQKLTYTLVPYNASAATVYTTVGIIGSATANGWDASTPMTLRDSAFDKHQWKLGVTPLTDGELKFRANNAWDVNWGGNTAFSGVGTINGPNVPVAKSKYVIYFNDLDGRYLMIPNQ